MTSPAPASAPADKETHKPSNFLRQIIEKDLAEGTYASRRWGGSPGDAAHHAAGQPDPAKVRLRFPPEPNGYLHVGHAKSICLNFGLARDYGGVCHLRFDDTNPEKEDTEYVDSIVDAVKWLGYDWTQIGADKADTRPYQASDYFDFMYRAAEYLIESGNAYVDEQSAEEMRQNRGDFGHPGTNSPFRGRTPAENLARFREMRDGKLADGAAVLRAKIDMASPNINMRDPAIYRIRRAHHHNTGDKWCIYPMYTYAHPIEDALEQITHSICTLEFQDHRPFYDWLLETLSEGGFFKKPVPHQYEFARLNLTYIVTSKRKLRQMVEEGIVDGWDDPRLPTMAGMRRRGFTPEGIQLMCERTGVTKSDGWIDFGVLEGAVREDLDPKAPRAIAVLRPLKLIVENFPEGQSVECTSPVHPHHPELGHRTFPFTRELWIEEEDFMEVPTKGYFRFTPPVGDQPGARVRLKYGFVAECTGYDKDENGKVTAVRVKYFEDSRSGTPGADTYKVKGNITWVSAEAALEAEVRLYDRLFTEEKPDAGGKDFKEFLNPKALEVVKAYLEPGLKDAVAEQRFQFERHGYFVADRVLSQPGKPVFNRIVTLKDSWAK